MGRVFAVNVDHMGFATGIKVSELIHQGIRALRYGSFAWVKRSDFLYHVFMSTRHLSAGGSKKNLPDAMLAKAGVMRAMCVPFMLVAYLLGGSLNSGVMAQTAPAAPALGANLPRLGDAGGEDLSPMAEQRLGEMAMREVRRDPDYLDDPEINDWLGQFGQRLVGSVPGGQL